jgi:LysM repeat protein
VDNISRGGALLYLPEQLETRDILRVAIEIPDCDDVITAEGTVVRTFSLKRGADQQFAFAVAIEFTEISENDLRFFSGNLALEWQEDYVEKKETETPSHSKHFLKKYTVFGIFFICISALWYFIPGSDGQDASASYQIERIDERLKIIEAQLQSIQSANVSIKNIEGKIDIIKDELAIVEKKLPAPEIFEKMRQKLDSNEQQTIVLSQAIGDYSKSMPRPSAENEITQSDAAYHVVKKGESLYRISLNYDLTLDEIRKMNKLTAGSQIFPGQKLAVR